MGSRWASSKQFESTVNSTFLVDRHNPELFLVLSGSVTLDELMTGLISAHETFQQAMDVEIREEVRKIKVKLELYLG